MFPGKFAPAAASLWVLLAVSPASGASKAVLSYASFNERTAGALLVAEDQGFFQKQGLDAQLVYVRTGSVALSALAAGESQFYFGSGTGATLGAIAGGLDAVFVAGLVNRLTGAFVAAPHIRTPADLRGKNIGVQSIGGGIWMITMLVLEHWGIDPKRDRLNLRIVGDEAVLAQSLASKAIDGSYFGYTFASILKRQGFNVLADLATLGIPYQSTGVLVRRSFVSSSPDVVEKVLRAMALATQFIARPENKKAVMQSLWKGLRLKRFEDAEEGYELMKTLYERRIYPNTDGIRNAIRLLGAGNDRIRQLRAENIVDDRIVRKLEKEGLF
ncbi:MAG TPA: ABC transporter substrate-binding protein [candidate division Zixibacteria bacterium]|nr:ABC transporter substrate-binding protein [candidate division Zixibacteria bacterium]